jgi:phosphoesterase RecJ-like protein
LKVIKAADIRIDYDIAENIFAAIQSDTGCFKYENTSQSALNIAAEMLGYGVDPWDVSKRMTDTYSLERLKLLEYLLGTVEFYNDGKVAIATISTEMFENSGANGEDCEGLVEFPRFVKGVEIALLIRQTGGSEYKFSLRSNNFVNVAQLAGIFGGGGHMRAAGFECRGSLENLKKVFIKETRRFLDGETN